MTKIFFGTAISDVPTNHADTHDENMEYLRKCLEDQFSKPNIFGFGNPADIDRSDYKQSDNQKLFRWYRDSIYKSDIFVADVTFASTGLGAELHIAAMFGKPVILVYDRSAFPSKLMSRMIHGLPNVIRVIPYENPKALLPNLIDECNKVSRSNFLTS